MYKQWISRMWLMMATLLLSVNALAFDSGVSGSIAARQLPPEAHDTLRLIRQGGPYPYDKDGTVFGNYERLLPQQKRGYYREFTVKTPYARNRGARRLVTGGEPRTTHEIYYTADHYRSFKRVTD